MAKFIVRKSDVSPALKTELENLCDGIEETDDCFELSPKAGWLVAIGLLLTDKSISYQLQFEGHTTQ